MSFTFNCRFTGLCGFVFNKPFASSPDRCRVLLPEGDLASVREGLSGHRSLLLIPRDNLRSTGGFEPNFVLTPNGRASIAIYFLGGHELSFNFHQQGRPLNLEVEASPIANPERPRGNERTSLLTLGRLERGAPGASVVAPSCLADPPDRTRVDSRVRINGGKMFVRSLTQFVDQGGNIQDDIWDFGVPRGSGIPFFLSQVLAEDVVLERRDLTSNVTLAGNRLDANLTPVFELEVGPVSAQQAVVEITVLSGELEGLFDLQMFRDDPNLAIDVRLLYRLSNAPRDAFGSIGVLPIPRRRRGGTGLSIHCPRALFVDDPNA